MNSRTNKKRNKNTTQKLWMNAPHNKNKKNRYFSRLSIRRSRRRRNNDDVFGDLAVPSLHDVTLKMHNVIDRADNAMMSFKPINYKRIHKRWKNKKYKVVSGGVGDAEIAEVKKGVIKLTGEVSGLSAKIAEIENVEATASPGVASKGDECLDSKERRTFSGSLQENNTVIISEVKPGTYPAFIEELAALGAEVTGDGDEEDGEGDGEDKGEKKKDEKKVGPIVPDSATATSVDAAAAAVAGAAGAAAAAALFTDDRTPAVIIPKVPKVPILSGFKIEPETVIIGDPVLNITKPTSESDGAITYSSSAPAVATIDAATGVIALLTPGKVTFTAKQAADPTNNFANAEIKSNDLTVKPAPPPPPPPPPPSPPALSSEPLRWADLKSRWVEVNDKCTNLPGYKADLIKDAGSSNIPQSTIGVTRKVIFDWLQISDPDFTDFDTTGVNEQKSKNRDLYDALSNWIAKWNEYSGKIRTIISIKGGEVGTSMEKPTIIKGVGLNTTKTAFRPDYKVPTADKQSYNLDDNQYGNFYAGFDANDTNAERYKKGNFKDLIGTLEQGGNAAIFGYGYSGSGKTYTLTNYNADNPEEHGIAIQLLQELLKKTPVPNIKLSISELYCSDFTITSRHEVKFAKITPTSSHKVQGVLEEIVINDINDFTNAIVYVKTERIKSGHIKYTLNNPESSRGHLFYKFEITIKGKKSVLTIVDMGGRENPVELSESSYMKVSKEGSGLIGQIVERVGENTAVFYSKSDTGEYHTESNENITGTKSAPLCTVIRHITGEHADTWSNKCPSIIASSFGGLFFSDFGVFNLDYSDYYSKFPLKQDLKLSDKDKQIILSKIKIFLEACKEGLYINETINHLVAYINFLSNIPKIKDIKIANVTDVTTGKGGLISLDATTKVGSSATSATVYTYHPERYIINPLEYIKFKDTVKDTQGKTKLEKLLDGGDTKFFDKISTTDSDDTIGILKELWEIKKPDETVPAIICFIACVRNDNTQIKNQTATKATLEFAMSVSASNAPPSGEVAVLSHDVASDSEMVIHGPVQDNWTPDELKLIIIKRTGTPAKITAEVKKVVEKFRHNYKKDKVKLTDKQEFVKLLKTHIETFPTADEIVRVISESEIVIPILKNYLKYIFSNMMGIMSSLNFTSSINNPDGYAGKLKNIIREAKFGTGGSGIRTRKHESRREKKNRITRRRNRV